MKGRMCRIIKDKSGGPQTGARRVLVVGAAVICASISIAWAQRTAREPSDPDSTVRSRTRQRQENPVVQPRTRERQEDPVAQPRTRQRQEDPGTQPRVRDPLQEQLMIQGQRAALEAILEAVRDIATSTEAALQEQGDARDDVTLVLRFELAEIQNHIRRLEGRLASLEQPAPTIRNQIARAEARLRRLQDQGQADSEEAQQIRERTQKMREQLAQQEAVEQPRQR